MRLASFKRAISVCAVSATGTALLAATSASAADDPAEPECLERTNIIQKETLLPDGGTVTDPQPGTLYTHKGTLYENGKKIGHTYGRGVVYRESGMPGTAQMLWGASVLNDGSFYGVDHINFAERDEFPGPTYTDDGVVGISGKYKGMVGNRTFGLVDKSDPAHPVFTWSVKVCKVAPPG